MAISDFPYGDIIHRCFRCGYCKFPVNWIDVNNCPAYGRYRLETYSCGGRLWLTRAWLSEQIAWTEHLAHIMFSCTACKNCELKCPFRFNVDILNMIIAAKGEMVERSLLPSKVKEFLQNLQVHGNPYEMVKAQRDAWAEGTAITPYEGHEYLYYVGCVGSYDSRARQAARAIGLVLKSANVSFGILGKQEICEGNEAFTMGEKGLFEILAEKNISLFKKLGVRKIVTLSPHAYNAIKNLYPWYGGEFEVVHYTQLLFELIHHNKLTFNNRFNARVTFHDPCFLGRWNGEYEAPRAILRKIPGITFLEMEKNKDSSLCCGGGGGNFYIDFLGTALLAPRTAACARPTKQGLSY